MCNEPPPPVAAATVRDFLTEISGREEADASSSDADAGDDISEALTDHQTIEDCRQRARQIEGEISTARRQGRESEVQRLMKELEKITEYIISTTERGNGHGPRRPRQFPNENEKARQRISHAIKRVFAKLKKHRYQKTRDYFERTLTLGQTGCFQDDTSDWQLEKPITDQ